MPQSSWKCPACDAMNTDKLGHCTGCGAWIDLDVVARSLSALAIKDSSREGEGAGPLLMVSIAVALMIAPFILAVRAAFESPATADQLYTLVWQGLLAGGFAAGLLKRLDWVRKLYLFFQVVVLVQFIFWTSPSGVTSLQIGLPVFLPLAAPIAACFILFLTPANAWFRPR